jgi:hypothetical protein
MNEMIQKCNIGEEIPKPVQHLHCQKTKKKKLMPIEKPENPRGSNLKKKQTKKYTRNQKQTKKNPEKANAN